MNGRPSNGKGRNPEQTRQAILKAAIAEFSREGVAGARTDQIARAAKVNKALLYYYFGDKESLHGAVLDHAFGSIYPRLAAILDSALPLQSMPWSLPSRRGRVPVTADP